MSLSISSLDVNLNTVSSIAGSVSIACWVVVYSPQIIENFRRRSAEGLSFAFVLTWLAGDVFNILGSVLQGVLPTMMILAVYYTLADVVLLVQMWWYRSRDEFSDAKHHSLIDGEHESANGESESHPRTIQQSSAVHLSPTTPLLDQPKSKNASMLNWKPQSIVQAFLFNTLIVILVCAVGVSGWWVFSQHHSQRHTHDESNLRGKLPHFHTFGQVFGYLCAVLYIGSRVPQLLLNYRRKSTEGVSLLFFLFIYIGNLTYSVSIFAFDPTLRCQGGPEHCKPGEASTIYSRYIAVNASWIIGKMVTLLLDLSILVQFFLYGKNEPEGQEGERRRNGSYDSITQARNPAGQT